MCHNVSMKSGSSHELFSDVRRNAIQVRASELKSSDSCLGPALMNGIRCFTALEYAAPNLGLANSFLKQESVGFFLKKLSATNGPS